MKKTVVLCEGKHDVVLLSLLFERLGVKYKRVFWEDIQRCSAKSQESFVIRQFLRPGNRDGSVLIKQDKDADTACRSFFGLFKTGSDYSLKLVTDSDGDAGLRKVRRVMQDMVGRDVLAGDESCEYVQVWKCGGKGPAVFFYPRIDSGGQGKLTDIVAEAGCGNLAGCRDSDGWEEILSEYLSQGPEWIDDLAAFLNE